MKKRRRMRWKKKKKKKKKPKPSVVKKKTWMQCHSRTGMRPDQCDSVHPSQEEQMKNSIQTIELRQHHSHHHSIGKWPHIDDDEDVVVVDDDDDDKPDDHERQKNLQNDQVSMY